MRSISKIYAAITEIWNAWSLRCIPLLSNFKESVSFDYGVSLRFVLLLALQTFWATFPAKNNARSTPASTALTHQSHNAHSGNRHLCGSGERNGEQRRTKVSFGRTVMQALEMLQAHLGMKQCRTVQKIKPVRSLSSYWVTLVWRH